LQPSQILSLKQLRDKKYAAVLCYPHYNREQASRRIRELMKLGVTALEFTGGKTAFNIPILGKGNVGLVVIAHLKTGRVALKIRRVDADRKEMKHETDMLIKANSIGVGPRFLGSSDNFLIMEFIEGKLLPQWIMQLKERSVKARVRKVLRDVLEQGWRMDQAGLDHGELSHAPKHIIIDANDKAHVVDFETASVLRRTSNVTSLCQYLFMKSQLAKNVRRRFRGIDLEELVVALRKYKQQPSRQSFNKILKKCELA